ncbi:MAG: metal ABC transporter permease [Planctomycetota bacterium]|jgi:ABC-type Mn2+/Zn2+ transport system permease subunit|nr:metal ABC transporter permease [Planctomycetota bacterium]
MEWLSEPFGFDFMRAALAGGIIAAIACALLGVHLVLRGMSFLGDALAHAALPGVVTAQMLGISLLVGAFSASLATALLVAWIARRRAVSEDSSLGVAYTGMFALGIVLLNRVGSYRDLAHLLLGNLLGITWSEVAIMAGLLVGIVLILALCHRQLLATTIDPHYCTRIGCNADLTRMVLLVLCAATIVMGIRVAGVVLTSAMLITPAATARLLDWRLVPTQVLAASISVLAIFVGLLLAYHLDLSGGAAVVLVLTAVFLIVRVGTALRQRSPASE